MDQLFREHDGEYIDLTTGQMQFIIDILVETGYIRCSKNADDPQKSKFSYILWLHHKLWFIRVMLPFCLIQLQSLVHEPFKSVTGVVQKQTTCWYRDCLIKYHWEFYCVSNQVVYFLYFLDYSSERNFEDSMYKNYGYKQLIRSIAIRVIAHSL